MASSSSSGSQVTEAIRQSVSWFRSELSTNSDISMAAAAIHSLTEMIKQSTANTVMELVEEISTCSRQLEAEARSIREENPLNRRSLISLESTCKVFSRFVLKIQESEFTEFKKQVISRAQNFLGFVKGSRDQIARSFEPFFRDRMVILMHGHSRVVLQTLIAAKLKNKRFSVLVTECRPDAEGYKTARVLKEAGIPATVILDSAVAYHMSSVDFVLVGAEGVMENGGIVNKVGTYQVAIIAATLNKPFYVAAESFKFARVFPLGQDDIPEGSKLSDRLLPVENGVEKFPAGVEVSNPMCDYTPPQFVRMLFSDIGILTPAAVSDELIKLYS